MDFLVTEAGAGAVDTMRTIKRALDPKNIMNPGKIFFALATPQLSIKPFSSSSEPK